MTPQQLQAMKLALDLATMHHTDDGYAELRAKVRSAIKEALAQPEQEPVAMHEDWYDSNSCGHCGMVGGHTKTCRHYTSPPAQRKPLTDAELRVIESKINPNMRWRSSDEEGITLYPQEYYDLVQAIEAAHGIKENT